MKPLRSLFSQQRILGGAAVLACTQLLASIAGLVRDRSLTSTFPDLNVVDVYVSSFRLSDLLFQMFIMAGFSVALVPLLAEKKIQKNEAESIDLLTGITSVAAIFYGTIAIITAIFFKDIAPFITNFTDTKLELYITYGRLALLTNFLFVFGNAFGQYLIAMQRYWAYGLTPVMYSIGTIFGTLFLTSDATFGELGPIIGTLIGAIVYVGVRMLFTFKHVGFVRWKFFSPGIGELLLLMTPRTIALGALQLQLLLFDVLASNLESGSITINAYARNFQSVAVGVAGIALAQSTFSLLSQAIAKNETVKFWHYMKRGLVMTLCITTTGAIVLAYIAPFAGSIVNITSLVFIFCLSIYCISIPFESCNHLLLRGFYAAKQTKIPAAFSVINALLSMTVSYNLLELMGVYALPIGFVVGQIIQMIALSILLPLTVKKTIAAKR